MGDRGRRGAESHRRRGGGSLSRRLEEFYLGSGGWPLDMMDVAVMRRMHWSEQDYLAASAPLVERIVLDMVAEGSAAATLARWEKR